VQTFTTLRLYEELKAEQLMAKPRGRAALYIERAPLPYVHKSNARRNILYSGNSYEKVKLKNTRHSKHAGEKDKVEAACHD